VIVLVGGCDALHICGSGRHTPFDQDQWPLGT
jgi:hypothetical protein